MLPAAKPISCRVTTAMESVRHAWLPSKVVVAYSKGKNSFSDNTYSIDGNTKLQLCNFFQVV